MTSSLVMTVQADKENEDWNKLMDQWGERITAIVQEFPYRVAQDVLEKLQGYAPQGRIDGYPDMLKVRKLPTKDGWTIVGILPPGWAFSQRLRTSDVKRTVLYVRPKIRAGVAVSTAAVILSRKNPWTMDTIPYETPREEASLLARRLTEREVRKVEEQRRHDRREVVIELKDAGYGEKIRPESKVLLSRKVSRDLAYEVLRAEFGNGMSGQPVAHWRPALKGVTGVITRKHFKDLIDWVADHGDRQYLRQKDPPMERGSVLESIQRFQDLVAPTG